jgi:hypothetical protein
VAVSSPEIGNNILCTTIYCYCVWYCVLCIDSDVYVCMYWEKIRHQYIAIRHENWQVGLGMRTGVYKIRHENMRTGR